MTSRQLFKVAEMLHFLPTDFSEPPFRDSSFKACSPFFGHSTGCTFSAMSLPCILIGFTCRHVEVPLHASIYLPWSSRWSYSALTHSIVKASSNFICWLCSYREAEICVIYPLTECTHRWLWFAQNHWECMICCSQFPLVHCIVIYFSSVAKMHMNKYF